MDRIPWARPSVVEARWALLLGRLINAGSARVNPHEAFSSGEFDMCKMGGIGRPIRRRLVSQCHRYT